MQSELHVDSCGLAGAPRLCSTALVGCTTNLLPFETAVPSTIKAYPPGSTGGHNKFTCGCSRASVALWRPGEVTTSSSSLQVTSTVPQYGRCSAATVKRYGLPTNVAISWRSRCSGSVATMTPYSTAEPPISADGARPRPLADPADGRSAAAGEIARPRETYPHPGAWVLLVGVRDMYSSRPSAPTHRAEGDGRPTDAAPGGDGGTLRLSGRPAQDATTKAALLDDADSTRWS